MTEQVHDRPVPPGPSDREDGAEDLATALLASARRIAGSERLAEALPQIAEGAATVVPGVRDAGVVLRRHDELSCAAHSSDTAEAVDRLQIAMAEGPCPDAIAGAAIVVLPDMTTETRWARFVWEANRHGVRASLSVRLGDGAPEGAVNLHVTRYALDDRTRRRTELSAQMFAAYATLALSAADRLEKLEGAIARRDVIGQAKGILMHRYRVDADEAFDRLRRASQTTNTKLYEVAAWLVARGDL